MKLHIEVRHTHDTLSVAEIAPVIDMDKGALAMPENFKLGSIGLDGEVIRSFDDKLSNYDIWFEKMVTKQDPAVCTALENIFTKAQGSGVILATTSVPSPYFTHAHLVRREIYKLAGIEPEKNNEK